MNFNFGFVFYTLGPQNLHKENFPNIKDISQYVSLQKSKVFSCYNRNPYEPSIPLLTFKPGLSRKAISVGSSVCIAVLSRVGKKNEQVVPIAGKRCRSRFNTIRGFRNL